MPLYSNSAFGAPFKTIKRADTVTEPNYLFGEFDFHTQPFKFQVTQVALAGNVATYTVQIAGGGGPNPNFLPKVGAKMGVRGNEHASGDLRGCGTEYAEPGPGDSRLIRAGQDLHGRGTVQICAERRQRC